MKTSKPMISKPPEILPVADGVHRPLWSVMIPTFNCADYLVQTLESVLAQAPGPEVMQIEVVDDCSTKDDPETVVKAIGKGRVSFYRQPQNGGATKNFNTCIERSTGQFIHILHGDDFVETDFYNQFQKMIEANPQSSLFACRAVHVDEAGEIDTLSPRLLSLEKQPAEITEFFYSNLFRTPAIVVKRDFYEKHGGFNLAFRHVADWEMWVRAIALTSGVAINKPLAYFRLFEGNDTNRLARNADNLRDYLLLANLFGDLYQGFDMDRFLHQLKMQAFVQTTKFVEIADRESLKKNAHFWWKLLNPQEKMKHCTAAISRIDKIRLMILWEAFT